MHIAHTAALRYCNVYVLNGILTFTGHDVYKLHERVKKRGNCWKSHFPQCFAIGQHMFW